MTEVNPIPEGAAGDDLGERRRRSSGSSRPPTSPAMRQRCGCCSARSWPCQRFRAHYVGVFTDNPASADALRAAEASLTARAEARQATFGRTLGAGREADDRGP